MELIVISDSKLKIMLTCEDLDSYSLDCNALDYENSDTRRAFWSILDEAKHRTGFDVAKEKVFVQVYPSRDGGCEMFVTKLGIFENEGLFGDDIDEDLRIVEGEAIKKGYATVTQENRPNVKDSTKAPATYRFEGIYELLCACRRLQKCGYRGKSSAYKGNGEYYLQMEKELPTSYGIGKKYFVLEYAREVETSVFETYISEYGSCICEKNAVSILSEL